MSLELSVLLFAPQYGPSSHTGSVIKDRKYVRHRLDSSLSRNRYPVDPRRKGTDLSLEPSVVIWCQAKSSSKE